MATSAFKFVVIPPEFSSLAGEPDAGTRMFRVEGDHNAMREWFDALCEFIGPCVSPGGAAVYAGVSRAGVYKRMKAGGLTAFHFHIIGKTKTIFGREKKLKEWPLCYIPISECKAWGAELEQRAARLKAGRGSEEDEAAFEEADPGIDDPNPDFIYYDPKDKGRRDVRYVTDGLRRPQEGEDEH